MTRRRLVSTLLLFSWLPSFAASAGEHGEDETFSVRAGPGFTASPTTFLMGVDVPFAVTKNVALGPSFQLGVDDDTTFFAPTWNVEFRLPLEDVTPYAYGGAGLGYVKKDHRHGDDDDAGFLFDLGIGLDFWVSDEIALGSRMTFNFMPSDVEGETFIFSWQVLTGRFSF